MEFNYPGPDRCLPLAHGEKQAALHVILDTPTEGPSVKGNPPARVASQAVSATIAGKNTRDNCPVLEGRLEIRSLP